MASSAELSSFLSTTAPSRCAPLRRLYGPRRRVSLGEHRLSPQVCDVELAALDPDWHERPYTPRPQIDPAAFAAMSDEQFSAAFARIEVWVDDQDARAAAAGALIRSWGHVTLERDAAAGSWLGIQQWTVHALYALGTRFREARAAGYQCSVTTATALVHALAATARRDGMWMAGHDASALPEFTRRCGRKRTAYFETMKALAHFGLLRTVFVGGKLRREERAACLVAGGRWRTMQYWRSVIQLIHPRGARRPQKPDSPTCSSLNNPSFSYQSGSTGRWPVDNRATRGEKAPPRTSRPRRRLDLAAVEAIRRAQRLSATFARASVGSLYPHVLKFVQRGARGGDLVDLVDQWHYAHDHRVPERIVNPTRWLIWVFRQCSVEQLLAWTQIRHRRAGRD